MHTLELIHRNECGQMGFVASVVRLLWSNRTLARKSLDEVAMLHKKLDNCPDTNEMLETYYPKVTAGCFLYFYQKPQLRRGE